MEKRKKDRLVEILKATIINEQYAQQQIYKVVLQFLDKQDYTNLRQFCNNYINQNKK